MSCHNSSSKFENVVLDTLNFIPQIENTDISLISENDFKYVLKSLNPKKACGLDGIHNKALLKLSQSAIFVSVCTNVFNQ